MSRESDMEKAVDKFLEQDLVVSRAEGRRIFHMLKERSNQQPKDIVDAVIRAQKKEEEEILPNQTIEFGGPNDRPLDI